MTRIRNTGLWILGILLLVAVALYVSYESAPRRFLQTFAFVMPAHVGPVGCVPNDFPGPEGNPDLHDAPYAPPAPHDIQHLEWLGPCVDEEALARAPDNFNDGVFVLPRQPRGGHRILPGDVLDVIVLVSTAFAAHPDLFGPLPLAVWFDWNRNSTFERMEKVVAVKVPIPFIFPGILPGVPPLILGSGRLSFPVTVPATYTGTTFPPIRARIALTEPLNAGMRMEFGEVEDYDFPLNYQALIPDYCPEPDEGELIALYFDDTGEVERIEKYDPKTCTRTYPEHLVEEAKAFYKERFGE